MTMLLYLICAVLGIVVGSLISLLLWKTGAWEEVIKDDFFRPNGFISYVFGCWKNPLAEDEEKMTNGERIRSMTDEELSKFLASDMHIACYYCDRCVCRGGDLECHSCRSTDMESILLSWLSKEHDPEIDVREDQK